MNKWKWGRGTRGHKVVTIPIREMEGRKCWRREFYPSPQDLLWLFSLWPVIRAVTLGFGHHSQGVCTLNMKFYLYKNIHPSLSCCKSLETLLYPSSDLILEAIRWHFSPHPQLWVVWYIFTLHVDNWRLKASSLAVLWCLCRLCSFAVLFLKITQPKPIPA